MLLTRLKPMPEILEQISGVGRLLILACNGCEESFGNSEPGRLRYLESEIEKNGGRVVHTLAIDFLCEPILVKHWLAGTESKVGFDAILVVSCGIGVQVVSAAAPSRTYAACDTVTMGGRFGQAWGKETCRECGACILVYTGGVCPLTACSKGLLNGPCGGSKDGRCEAYPERECGWSLIFERLKALGQTDLLLGPPLIKDWSKAEPPGELIQMRDQILERQNKTL